MIPRNCLLSLVLVMLAYFALTVVLVSQAWAAH